MKFYNRDEELATLDGMAEKAQITAQMTFIIGRRRIGKTKLMLECYQQNLVYFFVSRKSEALLCQEFIDQIQESLAIKVLGEFTQFSKLFEYLLELSKTRSFTLAIDEFQEFFTINPSIYSDMQNLWDRYKDAAKLNLVLCGSVYSLMHQIFENAKEPLYGRANKKMWLKPFNVDTIYEILNDHHANITPKSMLAFYGITGGVAKYVELLTEHLAFDLDSILDTFFNHSSLLNVA